jgi:hypothetical protein
MARRLCRQVEVPLLHDASPRQQIHSLYASTSWRITAPLRAVANALKRKS